MVQPVAQDHRLLKAIVIGLGILIVIGFGALVIGLATKGGQIAKTPGSAPLVLPDGAVIADMAISERQLVLRVTMGASEELIFVDPQSGRITGRIPVTRGAVPAH